MKFKHHLSMETKGFYKKTKEFFKKHGKKIAMIIIVLCLIAIATPFTCYKIVEWKAKERMFSNPNDIPYNRVGLLLGTNPKVKSGRDNYYFIYRIEAAAELYKAKKISKILVSGDNHIKEYDEPESMKQALMAKGIPEEDIVLDYAGFRTLDSIVRAKEIFGQTKITIISQQFHNERAICIALAHGIDAIGYNAKEIRGSRSHLKTGFLRETLARTKMFLDIYTGKDPKFLGEKIKI